MTRDELIRELLERHGHVSYKTMCDAVKHLTVTMMQVLSTGHRIEIRGFGSFDLRSRPPRITRNPKTGDKVQTAKKLSVHFKPGKELKERVNAYNATA